MDYGMLWFDNDPKTDLPQKIDRAAAYYRKKYGRKPNFCFVHPKMLGDTIQFKFPLNVKPSQSILLHHLWLGVAAENEIGESQ